MRRRNKILFVYQNYSTFVKNDFDILASFHEVHKYQFYRVKGILNTFWGMFRQFLYLLIHIWKYDAVYVWFADYFSFLPVVFAKVLFKKSFVVIGGYDVCRIKKLKYGALYNKSRGFFTVSSLKLCTTCITVSENIDRKTKFIAPNANRALIHNCIDPNISAPSYRKEQLIITVGNIDTGETIYVKGLDTFVEIARLMPDYKFLIIGFNKEQLTYDFLNIPANMEVLGKIPNQELMLYYARAKFYCQLSRSESFGVAIVESMLNGCIPVVTNEGGMPEIVGEKKYIVKRNPEHIKQAILALLSNESEADKKNRKDRVLQMFTIQKREDALKTLLDTYLKR